MQLCGLLDRESYISCSIVSFGCMEFVQSQAVTAWDVLCSKALQRVVALQIFRQFG